MRPSPPDQCRATYITVVNYTLAIAFGRARSIRFRSNFSGSAAGAGGKIGTKWGDAMNLGICRLFAIAICVFGGFGSIRTLAQSTASLALRSGAAADQEEVLWSFCAEGDCNGGSLPEAGLIMDKAGHLYGTTSAGVGGNCYSEACGAVFELAPNATKTKWTKTVLHRFCSEASCRDGATSRAGLIMDGSGHLYGTTFNGGAYGEGTVFELTPNAAKTKWNETVLYSFCADVGCIDGDAPLAGLIMDGSGNLYGTTIFGGDKNGCSVLAVGCGAVFELTPNAARTKWAETVLYSFCAKVNCIDGFKPEAGLIMDKAGHLYGTTSEGGTYGVGGPYGPGTVFELTPDAAKTSWTETVLHSFCSEPGCIDGYESEAGLIMDKAGHLYGTTSAGGPHGPGTVFEMTPNSTRTKWTETVLHGFCSEPDCIDGDEPLAGLIIDGSGNFYGTTSGGGMYGGGTVFELTPNTAKTVWTENVLYSFCARGNGNCTDGFYPQAEIIMDGSGNLYGTTFQGGAYVGYPYGTVFELQP
jgi:uncharacterized repeat protein (TIGR03803 family)